jgi:hypothetical protein
MQYNFDSPEPITLFLYAQKSEMPKKKRKQKSYYKKVAVHQFDLNWEAKLSELKLFKKQFGHCNVPNHWTENHSPGSWVVHQRSNREIMPVKRMDKLNNIGFIWDLPDYWWDCKYTELVNFKEKFGHCNVSKGIPGYLSLAEWCVKQRKDFKNGEKRLNDQKIGKLNRLGFLWGTITRVSWKYRYKELKKFKKQYGHCQVPQRWKENPALANWVGIQRRDRNKLLQERFALLDKLGFIWQVKKRRKL